MNESSNRYQEVANRHGIGLESVAALSIDSNRPTRILIDPSNDRDLLRLATTDYLISEYQKTYFVIEEFDLLQTITPERIVSLAKTA